MKMLFISYGNIPSRWAHTVQMMKMAEAFSRHVKNFRIVTRAHWCRRFQLPFDYRSFYGLQKKVRVAHLYSQEKPRGPVMEFVNAPGFAAKAAEYAIRKRFDLVFTRTPSAAKVCVEAGIPTIVETHNRADEKRFPDILAICKDPRFLGLVTISDLLRKEYLQAGVPDKKICVWPDAVDLTAFQNLSSKNTLRQNLDIPQTATVATYCGHLYEHRGVEDILEAATHLPNIHFLLVGGWEKDVEARRLEAKHLSNVQFTGFVDNRHVPSYLMASDFLLMPYSRACKTVDQMSPMKMFEYMASKRAIIASDFPAIRTHLRNETNSLLIPPDDASALVTAIRRLHAKPQFAEQLAREAYRDVRPYTWERRATKILDQFFRQPRPGTGSRSSRNAPSKPRKAA